MIAPNLTAPRQARVGRRPWFSGRGSAVAPNMPPNMPPPGASQLDVQRALVAVERRLAAPSASSPASSEPLLDLLFDRGVLLDRLGRADEARSSFFELLERAPSHRKALLQLGELLLDGGETAEARAAFESAVARHPDDPVGRVSLARLLIQEKEWDAARGHLLRALAVDPGCRSAHAGLSFALAELGEPEAAAARRRIAFQGRCVVPGPYRGARPPVAVLKLISTRGGNIRTEGLLSDCVFQTHLVAADFYDETTALPPHRLVVNAIGDAEIAGPALAGALRLVGRTAAPVVNAPAAVAATGRCEVARRLASVPGVVAPRTLRLPRELLAAPDAAAALARLGFRFPLLLRALGFHGGEHFVRADSPVELPARLAELPGGELNVIQFLDARGADGKIRKYRAMMIDGKLYPLHAAVASQWKVHYFSADMEDRPEHRAEDAAFLADMRGALGAPAVAALERIQATLGLDYGGIDFSLGRRGEVLLFEANATMAILPPGEDSRWDYRRPAVERVLRAVRRMLLDRAAETEQAAEMGLDRG
jgi:hypothetical protein